MLRFWGLVFLGRPRSPRVAGATDVQGAGRPAVLLPAALCLLLGIFPGLALGLMQPVLAQWLGPAVPGPGGVFGLSAGDAGARYLVLPAALLLGLLALALWRAGMFSAGGSAARAPAWDCGYIAPPPHMPFGFPDTQPSGAGFAQPIARMLGAPLLAGTDVVTVPPPGSPVPARRRAGTTDPTWAALAALRQARHGLSRFLDRLRTLSIRHSLGLMFATLVLLLAVLAVLERP